MREVDLAASTGGIRALWWPVDATLLAVLVMWHDHMRWLYKPIDGF